MINKDQLYQLVANDNKLFSLLSRSKEELSELFGMNFAEMHEYNQNNPHHCYNLLEHTIRTVIGIKKEHLSKMDFIELRVAGLFHDIGKPRVAFEKNGKTVFYNHAKESQRIAYPLLLKIGFDKPDSKRISFFIEQHDMFISFKKKEEMTKTNNPYIYPIVENTVVKQITYIQNDASNNNKYCPSSADFKALISLCKADVVAQSFVVFQDGQRVDSKQEKIDRLELITQIIDRISRERKAS